MFGKTFILLLSVCTLQGYGRDYNILDFGARADTSLLSTTAIQRAIDLCSSEGGGRVVVPRGSFKMGSIILRSHVDLHLEQGATLYGSTSIADYQPLKPTYRSLRTQTTTVQLIYADSAHHVSISGRGTIDGRGHVFKKLAVTDEGITRPHLLRFVQCSDVTIQDVTLRQAGCWMQHYLACDRLRITDINVFNRNNHNNDALDLDGCHDVIVRGMTSDSDDDGITIKSTSPRLSENIRISDCIVSSHCNAIKLGTESNGGFRDISISGIVVKPSEDQSQRFFGREKGLSAISVEMVDGGVLENVSISDITVEGTTSPIFIRLGNRARPCWEGSAKPGVGSLNGVYITGVHVRGASGYGCSITGLPGHPVQNVWLTDITIAHEGGVSSDALPALMEHVADEKVADYPECTMWGQLPAQGFFVRHAVGIHFRNVEIKATRPDARPFYVCQDASVEGAE